MGDIGILAAQIVIYYGVMFALFRYRHTLGIGTFFCALCTLTFAETYLAIAVFVSVGPVVYTPGSVLLFAGKLPLLLLAYIREDAATVRQPIYALLIGNLLIVVLLLLVAVQTPADEGQMRGALTVVASSAWLSVWGTVLLFVDCIAMILLYEKIARTGIPMFVRLWGPVALVLALDHVAFFAALNLYFGVPLSAGYGGLVGKLGASVVFCGLLWVYLSRIELREGDESPSLRDVFSVLTYRQRYEALHIESRIDPLTRARNRRAFHDEGPRAVAAALKNGTPLGLLAVDIDHFKTLNDQYGHAAGDEALHFLADQIMRTVRSTDAVYRIGGDEFIVLLPAAAQQPASRMAAEIRAATKTTPLAGGRGFVSASIGWATLRDDGTTLEDLTSVADRRLYEEKARRVFRPTLAATARTA